MHVLTHSPIHSLTSASMFRQPFGKLMWMSLERVLASHPLRSRSFSPMASACQRHQAFYFIYLYICTLYIGPPESEALILYLGG
jgi:hypothetical protein